MKLSAIWAAVLGLCLAVAVANASPRDPDHEPKNMRLAGTYLQLNASHLEWRDRDWIDLFDHFAALGLTQLIVQWSVYEDRYFYVRPGEEVRRAAPIETILELAERAGMGVWLGLASEERYWTEIAAKPDAVKPYLDDLRARSTVIARELLPVTQRHRSFAGWYIAQEIDDLSWREREYRELMYVFVGELSVELQRLKPGSAVAVSGFANGALDPLAFQAFWEELLRRAPPVNTVLFQDGIGARKLDLYELPLYTAAIRQAANVTSRNIVAIVELFDQVSGPPLDENVFQAVPAPLSRIIRQLEVAHSYAPSVVAFSVPEYLSPRGGDAARTLYDEYLAACVAQMCTAQGKQKGSP